METRFLRRIKGIPRRDRIRNTVVVEELNIAPIEKIIEERQLSLFGHVHIMNDERLAREIFEVRVPGINEVGRLQRSWIEQVRQTAEQRDINWREVGTLVQNREAWKRKIRHNRNP